MAINTESFHLSGVCNTGFSDFHGLTLIISKVIHVKHKLKITQYRDCNRFENSGKLLNQMLLIILSKTRK